MACNRCSRLVLYVESVAYTARLLLADVFFYTDYNFSHLCMCVIFATLKGTYFAM